MSAKKKVVVYGVEKEKLLPAGCSCGGDTCAPTQTTGEMYREMIDHLQKTVGDVDCSFVEISDPGAQDADDVRAMMDKGHAPPYVRVNGELRFFGGISSKALEILLTDSQVDSTPFSG